MDYWVRSESFAPGFRQFFREWRPPDTPLLPVLALHGSLTQSGAWILQAETAGSVRMLCPDQRGYGRSGHPGGDSCAEFSSDAIALAEAFLPERYVVMAHSFACSIALEVARAAADHVAGVVLVDPVVPKTKIQQAAQPSPQLQKPEAFDTLEDVERYFRLTEEGYWSDDALRRFAQDIMMQEPESGRWRFPYSSARLARLREFSASAGSDFDLISKAQAVSSPTLIFRGGMSRRFSAESEKAFLEVFPSTPQIVVCPDSGHFPTATEPRIVSQALLRFLNEVS